MVQIRSLSGVKSGNNIVIVEVVFPSGAVKAISLSETKIRQALQKYPDGYVEFDIGSEIQRIYFDYYKYPDGNYAFILSEQPIEVNWWSTA